MPQVNDKLRYYWSLFKDVAARFVEEDVPTQSAALSYYMVFSLPSTLLFVFWIAARFYKEAAVQEAVFAEISALAGDEGARQILATIDGLDFREPSWWATGFGLIVLLFTASTVLATLQKALNQAFDVAPADSVGLGIWQLLRQRIVSLGMLITLSFVLVVSLATSALVTAFDLYLARWLGDFSMLLVAVDSMLLSFGSNTLVFALMFRFLPDQHPGWPHIWFGAALTAALFAAGESLIALLIGSSDVANLYDAAGSILVLMMWVFYASAIFLFGALVTAARANGDVS